MKFNPLFFCRIFYPLFMNGVESIWQLIRIYFTLIFSGILNFSPALICNRIRGLSPKQKKICAEAPDAFVALSNGHQLGDLECQHQFTGEIQIFIKFLHLKSLLWHFLPFPVLNENVHT